MTVIARLSCLLTSCILLTGVSLADRPQQDYPEGHIRLESESPIRQKLSTPVATYVNDDGQRVMLFGAIHVAEPEYFDALNKLFSQCEILLFEMVGGENLQDELALEKKREAGTATDEEQKILEDLEEHAEKRDNVMQDLPLRLLGGSYKYASRVLNLQTQNEGIDYSPESFIHADMTIDELNEAQKAKGESFIKIFVNELVNDFVNEIVGLRMPSYQPNAQELAMYLATGNIIMLKNELMRLFAYGNSQGSLSDTVILEGRNKKCMTVFDRERSKVKGTGPIGIFYGAAHMPGLHKELLTRGYRLQDVQWLTAWHTDPEEQAPAVRDTSKEN